MNTSTTEPISLNWTARTNRLQLAQSICEQLAQRETSEFGGDLIATLAEAAAEMVEQVGLAWPVAIDQAPIVSIRMIARAAALDPAVGGPRSAALLDRLLP